MTPLNDIDFKQILINQFFCSKCERKGDKTILNSQLLTQRNSPIKLNSKYLNWLKSSPEDNIAIQCSYCSEVYVINRIKFESLVINSNAIGKWNENLSIKLIQERIILE